MHPTTPCRVPGGGTARISRISRKEGEEVPGRPAIHSDRPIVQGLGKYELGQRQQRPRRMKPPGMGLSMGTGVRPAGGLQDIDDGLICCASLLKLKGGKQMSVLHETLRIGQRP